MAKIYEGLVFKPSAYKFASADFESMAKALNRDFLAKQDKETLQRICNDFLLVLSYSTVELPTVDIRDKLDLMRSASKQMLETLHSLYIGNERERAAREVAAHLLNAADPNRDWEMGGPDSDALTEMLACFGSAAASAISNLPKDIGGRPKDLAIEFLTPALANFFQTTTTKNASITTDSTAPSNNEFKGVFLNFVVAFLEPLSAHYPLETRKIGSKVRRILKRK